MFRFKMQPIKLPKLPTPEAARAHPHALGDWQAATEATQKHNEEIFEKDLKIMKLCAFFNGMLSRSLSNHFSWCPHEHWEAYWKDQGWPELPKI